MDVYQMEIEDCKVIQIDIYNNFLELDKAPSRVMITYQGKETTKHYKTKEVYAKTNEDLAETIKKFCRNVPVNKVSVWFSVNMGCML